MAKICSTCSREKDLSEFGLRSGQPLKSCKECRSKDNARCAQDRDRIREYGRAWRAAHAEQEKTRYEKRKAAEREKERARAARRRLERQANPEPTRARERARRAKNPEKAREQRKAWAAANRPKVREITRLSVSRREARKRNLPGTFSEQEKIFMLQYFGYACAACGRQEGFTHTLANDHWIPLNSPECPGTVAWNIVPLCHGLYGCNNSKSAIDARTWLKEKFGKRKAAAILKRIQAYFDIVKQRNMPSEETG